MCIRDSSTTVHNCGDAPMPFSFGLHPYFNVSDLAQTRLTGLAERCLNHLEMVAAATADQLKQLEALALNQQLSAERQACSDALTTPFDASPSAQLVRLVLPPAQLHRLLRDEAMRALKPWTWELAAGAGCGDGWCDAATACLLYTSPSPRDRTRSRMPSSA